MVLLIATSAILEPLEETAIATKYTANQQSFYETDYLKWIESTVEKLRTGDYANIEWENLIAEIEDMGQSERRSLESNLVIVC
ncbi:MAG: DUF29 family protein [Nostocaceae cyanobacterium]|nr:DUF29 family protein [Nostocaceae cyanobacterium]